MIDISVIGAGPSGSLASLEAARLGMNVKVFEKRSRIGIPNHCSGLISKKGFEKIGLKIPESMIQNRISGSIFHSPKETLKFRRKEDNEMIVVHRHLLDQWLADLAQKSGAEIQLNTMIKVIKKEHKKWILMDNSGKEYQTKLIINAEGSHRQIIKQIPLKGFDKKWSLPAIQFELENCNFNSEYVELFHGKKWAPGFFAWIIPTSAETGRIGLAIDRRYLSSKYGMKDWLIHFKNHHPIASKKLLNSKVVKTRGGFVPAFGPVNNTVMDGLMLIGDAAGQAKATTGGGVNIGGYCGRIAGKIATESIKHNNTSKKFLQKYENQWKKRFWYELYFMTWYRKIIGSVSDETLDRLLKAAKESGFRNSLLNVKDIDLHFKGLFYSGLNSKVIKAGIRSIPDLLKQFSLEILL